MSEQQVHGWIRPAEDKRALRAYRETFFVAGCCALVVGSFGFSAAATALGAISAVALILWLVGRVFTFGYDHAAGYITEEYARAAVVREADHKTWSKVKPTKDGRGFLYVIRFSTGVVKVGQTNNPARRIGEHRRDAFAYNVLMINVWVSAPHTNYISNEPKLIRAAHRSGGRVKREYFHGADFDMVVSAGRDLANHGHCLN